MGMIPLDGWGRNGAAVSTNGAAVASDFLVHSPTDPAQGVVVADPVVFEGKRSDKRRCVIQWRPHEENHLTLLSILKRRWP
ncbi:hypothetical protein RRG08_018277 [Elysia crispata]|uniref:Uncharacterized protein n=1 Tax=Elysia crispata TaxID=231223 RepID=A0AAE0ZZU9_9GAST|nr:hypothetical protein RRG08_018277 [Elysia crispata]